MSPKTVVAIAGLPTSGKTTLLEMLAVATGVHSVDIDRDLARLLPPQESDPYASEESREREIRRMIGLYILLHDVVGATLSMGSSLIIAATYSRSASRKFLLEAAGRGGGQVKFVLCQYRDTFEEIERRVNDRLARGGVGGCRSVSHYYEDRTRYVPFDPVQNPHIVVMMEGGEEGTQRAVQQALAYINQE